MNAYCKDWSSLLIDLRSSRPRRQLSTRPARVAFARPAWPREPGPPGALSVRQAERAPQDSRSQISPPATQALCFRLQPARGLRLRDVRIWVRCFIGLGVPQLSRAPPPRLEPRRMLPTRATFLIDGDIACLNELAPCRQLCYLAATRPPPGPVTRRPAPRKLPTPIDLPPASTFWRQQPATRLHRAVRLRPGDRKCCRACKGSPARRYLGVTRGNRPGLRRWQFNGLCTPGPELPKAPTRSRPAPGRSRRRVAQVAEGKTRAWNCWS